MGAPGEPQGPVLVVFNQFPKRSETFLFREFVAWRRRGIEVRAFSLLPPEADLASEMDPWRHDVLYLHTLLRPGPVWHWLVAASGGLARAFGGGACPSPPSGRLRVAVAGWAAGLALAQVARHLGARRIHAAWGNAPAEAALHASRQTGLPYTVSLHAADFWRDTRAHAPRLVAAEWLFVCNRALASDVLRDNPALEPRLRLVPHGLDTERFQPVARRAGPPWRLLAVSRLVPKKGLEVLVDVCRRLDSAGLDFACEVVGGGPLAGSLLRRVREAGLGSRVRLTGPRDHDAVARAMAHSHVLVMPSRVAEDGDREGLPNVLLEALLTGLPVVATRTGSVGEVLTHDETGYLADVDDAAGLARAVVDLTSSYSRGLELGAAGRERVLQRVSRGDQGEALAAVFEGDPVRRGSD